VTDNGTFFSVIRQITSSAFIGAQFLGVMFDGGDIKKSCPARKTPLAFPLSDEVRAWLSGRALPSHN
jgi:hypothetical protein